MQERHGHQPFGDEAGALGGLPGEARILENVLDHERLPADEDEAGDSGAGRKALADERVGSFAGNRFEDELVGLLVQKEDRGRLGLEDRPGHVDDRLQERLELLFRAEDAGGHGRPQLVAHLPPPTLFAAR